MPAGISASDRKLLLVCGVLFVLLMTASILFSSAPGEFASPVPSTYSSQSDGARAAYLLLARLHYPVRRWESPPNELPFPEAENVLLIFAEPTDAPTDKERQSIISLVRGGGHVLFTGPNLPIFFPSQDVSPEPPDPKESTFTPNLPTLAGRGVQHITMQPRAGWGDLSESQLVLYGTQESPAVVAWRFSDGEIEWWAGSTPLNNAGITRTDNLTFFLDSVTNPSTGQPFDIYWDEYFHGQRNSLLSYARKPALLLGLAQIGLLMAAVLFTFSRRSGPVYVPPGVSRLSPLEFVDTLGGLYERAGAAASAVTVSYLRLRFLLQRQLGLPSEISDAELARAAEERLGWKDFQKSDLLQRAGAARRNPNMRDDAALELVQELERQAAELGI